MINALILEEYSIDGVYVAVKWDTKAMEQLAEYFHDKIPEPFPAKDMHTTLACSRTYFTHKLSNDVFIAEIDKLHIFKNEKLGHTALVILLKSDSLSKRHEVIHQDENASYDFDEYKPHITLSYDVSSMSEEDLKYILSIEFLSKLKEQNVIIQNGKEYTEKLKDIDSDT